MIIEVLLSVLISLVLFGYFAHIIIFKIIPQYVLGFLEMGEKRGIMNGYILPVILVAVIIITLLSVFLFSCVPCRYSSNALFTSDEVIRLLAQNPTWIASAPETVHHGSMHARCRVQYITGAKRVIIFSASENAYEWIPIRNDWTVTQSDTPQEPLL